MHAGEIVDQREISCPKLKEEDWATNDQWPVGYGFVAHLYQGEFYIWGGNSTSNHKSLPRDVISIFNIQTKSWRKMKVTGDIHQHSISCASALLHETMYIYGGFDPVTDKPTNNISTLSLTSGAFTLLPVVGVCPSRRSGLRGWFYDGKFYIFAGYQEEGEGEEIRDLLCRFDTTLLSWSKVETSGADVDPGGDYAAAIVGHHVYIHGVSLNLFNSKYLYNAR